MLSLVHHINPHIRLSTASSLADSSAYGLENLLIQGGFEEKHRQPERMAKAFSELSEREILALAISLEVYPSRSAARAAFRARPACFPRSQAHGVHFGC